MMSIPLTPLRGAKGDDCRGVSRNAPTFLRWIPAFAGMTKDGSHSSRILTPTRR